MLPTKGWKNFTVLWETWKKDFGSTIVSGIPTFLRQINEDKGKSERMAYYFDYFLFFVCGKRWCFIIKNDTFLRSSYTTIYLLTLQSHFNLEFPTKILILLIKLKESLKNFVTKKYLFV